MRVFSSKWGVLNDALLATIYTVDARGQADPAAERVTIRGPITDGNVEIVANWQSPFEQSGADTKAPFLTGLLQSGSVESFIPALLGAGYEGEASVVAELGRAARDASRQAQGRSAQTKLNSMMVFAGASPVKLPLTIYFRAFDDPQAEVQDCIDALAKLTLSRQLAQSGGLAEAIKALRSGGGFLKALLPSEAPQMVALKYGGYTLLPMVIESMTMPLTVPRDGRGRPLFVAVQLTLATLTALDRDDWTRARRGQSIKLFNN
jgi:hypothetical protein